MSVNRVRVPVIALSMLLAGIGGPAALAHSTGGSTGGHSFAGHAGGFVGHAGGFHAASPGNHWGGYGGGYGGRTGSYARASGSLPVQHFTPHSYSPPQTASYAAMPHAPAHRSAPAAGHTAVASGYGLGFAPGWRTDGRGNYVHDGNYARDSSVRGYPHGAWRGGYVNTHPHWDGGYWRGRWWPGVYYGAGFAWFLAALPLYCPVFWWDSVPYYYYNDVYYTWNPSADGYVATDPPPVAVAPAAPANDAPADLSGSGVSGYDPASAPAPGSEAPIDSGYPQGPLPASGGSNVFAYPSNGQTAEQQAADRSECERWAGTQAGGAGSADYRRAVIACFQGRGYSAQ